MTPRPALPHVAALPLAVALHLAALAFAGPALAQRAKPTPAPAPAAVAPAPPAPPAPPAASAPSALASQSTDELIRRARQLHEQLEYDQVLPLVQEVIAREGVPIEQRLDAYVLEGSCLAVIGNTIDAEGPFRRLLRGRPDFDLPIDTPPKILSVFRKVQAEEKAIAEQMEALTRGRIVKEMALLGAHPQNLKGGRPIVFDYVLKDPAVATQTVRVQYRRQGEPAYSSLALQRAAAGGWRGQIPGEWTANDNGAVVEMYIETLDARGPLLMVGTAAAPMVANIAPGQVDRSSPPPLPPWSVWTGAATTGVLLAAGAGFGAGMSVVQAEYTALGNLAVTEPIDGAELQAKLALGESLSVAANSLFIASAVVGVGTLVAGAFFTDWEGRGSAEDADAPATPAAAAASAR